jgi:hypothetical protein
MCRGPAPGATVANGGSCGASVPIDHHFVQAEVADEHELACRIERDAMSVRTFLPLRVHAAALVLNERRALAKRSVLSHRKRRHTAAAVVGHQHVPAGAVEHDVTRPGAAGGLLIDERQLPRLVVDKKRADAAAGRAVEFIDLVDGKHQPPRTIDRQERWAGRFDGQAKGLESDNLRARDVRRFQPKQVDALALVAGIRADVNESFIACSPDVLSGKPHGRRGR